MDTPTKKKKYLEKFTIETRPLTSTGFEKIQVGITLTRRMWEKVDELRGESTRSEWFNKKVLDAKR